MVDHHDMPGGLFGALDRGLGLLINATLAVSAFIALTLALLGATDRVALALFQFSIPSAVELSSALLAALVLGTLAATQRRRANIEISLVLELMPPRARAVLRRVMLVVTACVVAYLAWRLSALAGRSFAAREFATGLWSFPVYPFKIWCAAIAWLAMVEFAWQALFLHRIQVEANRAPDGD